MLRFIPLASSSSGCCYLVTCRPYPPLLIECGIHYHLIAKFIWSEGGRVSTLAGCLVSHAHGDHCKAVKALLAGGVDCYASAEAWAQMPTTHRSLTLVPGTETRIGDWTVKPFLAEHDSPGTLGFLIGAPDGKRLLYITDSSFVRYTFEPCHVIAIEANYSREIIRAGAMSGDIGRNRFRHTLTGHMDIRTTIQTLLANDLSQCEAIHLMHLSAENSDEADFKDQVQKATGRPVYVCPEFAEGVR